MNNHCPKCNAEPKEKEIIEYCSLAGENANHDQVLKACIIPNRLQAARSSDYLTDDPCLDCRHNKIVVRSQGTLDKFIMVNAPTKTEKPIFQQTHICCCCGTKYKFII